ncbi:MBL fold metallo-hydrolase [Limibacter armeniacum]|uniref:MBL fold metallo-hydrolase n=1 Tax=Limibacter armeniacum TaxID=466084 RepID=UPI002FE55BE4
MKVEQLYTKCLSEASYIIISDGEAAVVDPIRESAPYLAIAKEHNASIKYILETHFHADFVSGHLELAKQTGATIVYGPNANPSYDVHVAKDEETFSLGNATIQVLHTPGHTLESSSFLLKDEAGNDHAVFTGDTLFVGEVGRPDLAVNQDISREDLASMLYDSLNTKIKSLSDEVIVYPEHGAGSACGKNIGKENSSTIGEQKQSNYALQDMSREQFVAKLTDGLVAPPAYFFEDAKINKQGYKPLDEVFSANMNGLSLEEVEKAQNKGALVLDARTPDEFEKGFVKGALNIGLNGQFAIWVGTMVDIKRELIIVAKDIEQVRETVTRLARIGYENVLGYLEGGFGAWEFAKKPIDTVDSISAAEAVKEMKRMSDVTLDVREPGEVEKAHIDGAKVIRLQELLHRHSELDKETTGYLVHCGGGYRSMIAVSLLKQLGFTHLKNIKGGFAALEKEHAPIVFGKK